MPKYEYMLCCMFEIPMHVGNNSHFENVFTDAATNVKWIVVALSTDKLPMEFDMMNNVKDVIFLKYNSSSTKSLINFFNCSVNYSLIKLPD